MVLAQVDNLVLMNNLSLRVSLPVLLYYGTKKTRGDLHPPARTDGS